MPSPASLSGGFGSEIESVPPLYVTFGVFGGRLQSPTPQSGSTVSGDDAALARCPLWPLSYALTVRTSGRTDDTSAGSVSRHDSFVVNGQTTVLPRKTW